MDAIVDGFNVMRQPKKLHQAVQVSLEIVLVQGPQLVDHVGEDATSGFVREPTDGLQGVEQLVLFLRDGFWEFLLAHGRKVFVDERLDECR